MTPPRDPVGVVEAAYEAIDAPTGTWLQRIADAASCLDSGFGVMAGLFDWSDPDHLAMEVGVSRETAPQYVQAMAEAYRDFPLSVRMSMAAFGAGFAADRVPESPNLADVPGGEFLTRVGIQGAFGIVGVDESLRGIMLSIATPVPRRRELLPMRPWRRVAAHLTTAVRLRSKRAPESAEPEAVLQPNGLIVHATGEAKESACREQLGVAARRMDRSRTREARNDASHALELWNALVAGRWSLIDTYESDGKRVLVAHRNEAPAPLSSTLTPREGQIAGLVAAGRSNRDIAYELGIGPSTVETLVLRVRRRLGVTSRAALAGLIASRVAGER